MGIIWCHFELSYIHMAINVSSLVSDMNTFYTIYITSLATAGDKMFLFG